jgi:hypothetical protein
VREGSHAINDGFILGERMMSLHFDNFKNFSMARDFAVTVRDTTNLACKVWIPRTKDEHLFVTVERGHLQQELQAIGIVDRFGGEYTGT